MLERLLPITGVLLLLLSVSPWGTGFRSWIMFRLYQVVQKKFEPYIAERKRRLFSELSGTVLEIGPGNGANLDHMPHGIERWIGIEPNPHMHSELRNSLARRSFECAFQDGSAQAIPHENQSVDAVISTHVLCSVPDPEQVLREILRVLRPGGQFVFIEHVAAAPGSTRLRLQRLVKPFWWYLAGGCRPDRNLAAVIRRAGFTSLRLDTFAVPRQAAPAMVSPHVAGVAVK